jgi:hypothetical protein
MFFLAATSKRLQSLRGMMQRLVDGWGDDRSQPGNGFSPPQNADKTRK